MKFIYKNDDINKKIGKSIYNHRRKKGITQEEMAKLLGVSRTTLSFYENGIKKISLAQLYKIAEILGLNIQDLFVDDFVENKYFGSIQLDVEFELEMAIKHFLIAHNKSWNDKKLKNIVEKIKKYLLKN